MREIYIDASCKAHTAAEDGYRPLTVDMLDGFCDTFIEGLMVVPGGEIAIHPDGRTLIGFTVAPWKDSAELDSAQRRYERELLAEYAEALATLGVTV